MRYDYYKSGKQWAKECMDGVQYTRERLRDVAVDFAIQRVVPETEVENFFRGVCAYYNEYLAAEAEMGRKLAVYIDLARKIFEG